MIIFPLMTQFARNIRLFTVLALVVLLLLALLRSETPPVHDDGRRRLSCAWSAWRHKMQCEAGEERISKSHNTVSTPNVHSVAPQSSVSEASNHLLAVEDSNGPSSAKHQTIKPPLETENAPDAHSDHKEALAQGRSLAARYHSPICLAARSEEQFRELKRVMRYTQYNQTNYSSLAFNRY